LPERIEKYPDPCGERDHTQRGAGHNGGGLGHEIAAGFLRLQEVTDRTVGRWLGMAHATDSRNGPGRNALASVHADPRNAERRIVREGSEKSKEKLAGREGTVRC
jgi:hypothetical protein